MNNGIVAIARIPYSNVSPTHLIMASKVATIEFARYFYLSTPLALEMLANATHLKKLEQF